MITEWSWNTVFDYGNYERKVMKKKDMMKQKYISLSFVKFIIVKNEDIFFSTIQFYTWQ